eukprot:GEMP01014429.1.p1 GENE.GEMP01014429.1~~GEMP01014429.1.p1  ORF type:complete len:666 (+),score=131.17 GEMP01014429.1:22-2019(+)
MSANGEDARRRRIVFFSQSYKSCFSRSLRHLAHLNRSYPPPFEVLCIVPDNEADPWTPLGFRGVRLTDRKSIASEVDAFAPDLIVSMLYPKRIENEVLACAPDAINFHPSLLPKHRGSLTQFWAIFDGDAETGCTCHRMVHSFDAGNILHQSKCSIDVDETALSLQDKISDVLATCFQDIIRGYLARGFLPPDIPQGEHNFPYHPRRFPNDGEIDPCWNADKIERYIRAMYCPPFEPAMMRKADGTSIPVINMREFEMACNIYVPLSHKIRGTVTFLRSSSATFHDALRRGFWGFRHRAFFVVVVAMAMTWTGLLTMADPSVFIRKPSSGRCLDGSTTNYYIAPGSSRSWLIYLQGGGWCSELPYAENYNWDSTISHPDNCQHRATTYLGSSNYDVLWRDLRHKGYLSGDPMRNPLAAWRRVIVRNCDGTSFLSTKGEDKDRGLYFQGEANIFATLHDLVASEGLAYAEEVIVAGCSSGGIAVLAHLDAIRYWLRRHTAVASSQPSAATVTLPFVAGLVDSGIFPAHNTSSALHFPQFPWIQEHTIAAAVPKWMMHASSCSSDNDDDNVDPEGTPMFVYQSVRDTWQVLKDKDSADFEEVMNATVTKLIGGNARHGGFVDNCHRHCTMWTDAPHGDKSAAKHFMEWYRQVRSNENGTAVHRRTTC